MGPLWFSIDRLFLFPICHFPVTLVIYRLRCPPHGVWLFNFLASLLITHCLLLVTHYFIKYERIEIRGRTNFFLFPIYHRFFSFLSFFFSHLSTPIYPSHFTVIFSPEILFPFPPILYITLYLTVPLTVSDIITEIPLLLY